MRIRRSPGIGPGGATTNGGRAGDGTATAPRGTGTRRVGLAVARRFPPARTSVGRARHFLRQQFDPGRADADAVEVLALMLSELATNAVQHARTAFEVAIWVTPQAEGHAVLVRVTDGATGCPVARDAPADASHGRGLRIVESLAAGWGVEVPQGRPGKTVWFKANVGPAVAAGDGRGRGEVDGPAPPALGRGRGRTGRMVPAS